MAAIVARAVAIRARCVNRAPCTRPAMAEAYTTTHSSSRPSASRDPSSARPRCDPRSISCARPAIITRANRGASSNRTNGMPGGRCGAKVLMVNTAPTCASLNCQAISGAAVRVLRSTAPRPSEAARAVMKDGPVGRSSAERRPVSARTRGGDRCRSVTPAATSC